MILICEDCGVSLQSNNRDVFFLGDADMSSASCLMISLNCYQLLIGNRAERYSIGRVKAFPNLVVLNIEGIEPSRGPSIFIFLKSLER